MDNKDLAVIKKRRHSITGGNTWTYDSLSHSIEAGALGRRRAICYLVDSDLLGNFIAHAPKDIVDLLSETERLIEENARLTAENERLTTENEQMYHDAETTNANLIAMVERLEKLKQSK